MMLKKNFKFSLFLLCALIVSGISISSCSSDDDSPAQSSENLITSFVFSNLTPPVGGTINNNSISVIVDANVNVTSLAPTIIISPEASVVPASGSAQDFSSAVVYTVTAEDGSEANYTVTVAVQQSSEAEIISFTFNDFTPGLDANISNNSVSATVPFDADVTNLTPTIVISDNATIAPNTGAAQDFTNPVTYTVTAEDGTTNDFTVTITVAEAPGVNITAVWEKNLVSGGLPSWFTANNDRDLSVSSEYIYVHNNNDKIRVLSLADGSDVSAGVDGDVANPNKEFINGKQNFATGDLFLLGTSTDSDGKIIASNFRIGSTAQNPWNVYKWNDKDSDQELLLSYPTPTGTKLGDNITVLGDVSGEATIFAPSAGPTSNEILKFAINGGVANDTPDTITLNGLTGLGNVPDLSLVSSSADANFILTGTGVGGIAEYAQDGTLVGKLDASLDDGDTAPLFTFALDVKQFEISGRKFIATTSTDFTDNAADDGYLYIIDYTDGLDNVTLDDIERVRFTPVGNIDTNLNGTGGVDVSVEGNVATVYAILTNFGIGAYQVTYN